MGKGPKTPNSKAKQKKQERLELERLMNSRIQLVKKANQQENPLDQLPSFTSFTKNGLNVELRTQRVTDLDSVTKDWLMELITANMKKLYEESNWGWKTSSKKEEMTEDAAWYLIARDLDSGGKPVAFSHFRFDMDYDDEVLYVYEIQMEEAYRRKGLGRFMMQILELMCFKNDLRKIMVTVFKHNPQAKKFFRDTMKFVTDETCPIDDVYEQYDYEILSKFNKRKLAREAADSENNSSVAN